MQDIFSLQRVSKGFYSLMNKDVFWKFFYRNFSWNYISEELKRKLEQLDETGDAPMSECCWKKEFQREFFSEEQSLIRKIERFDKKIQCKEEEVRQIESKSHEMNKEIFLEMEKRDKMFSVLNKEETVVKRQIYSEDAELRKILKMEEMTEEQLRNKFSVESRKKLEDWTKNLTQYSRRFICLGILLYLLAAKVFQFLLTLLIFSFSCWVVSKVINEHNVGRFTISERKIMLSAEKQLEKFYLKKEEWKEDAKKRIEHLQQQVERLKLIKEHQDNYKGLRYNKTWLDDKEREISKIKSEVINLKMEIGEMRRKKPKASQLGGSLPEKPSKLVTGFMSIATGLLFTPFFVNDYKTKMEKYKKAKEESDKKISRVNEGIRLAKQRKELKTTI